MPKETVRWNKPQFNNFIAVPRIAKYELDPYEFKLYSHYIDETRWGSSCNQGTRTIAALINMSRNAVLRARKSLEEKGYLTVEAGEAGESDLIILNAEVWQRNADQYEKPVPPDSTGVYCQTVHPVLPDSTPRTATQYTSNIEDKKIKTSGSPSGELRASEEEEYQALLNQRLNKPQPVTDEPEKDPGQKKACFKGL